VKRNKGDKLAKWPGLTATATGSVTKLEAGESWLKACYDLPSVRIHGIPAAPHMLLYHYRYIEDALLYVMRMFLNGCCVQGCDTNSCGWINFFDGLLVDQYLLRR
jgi:hypothetical protein